MVHGWFSHRGVWRQTWERFKESYSCIAVDLLGFGDSDKPQDADYSIEAQAQRILRLADKLDCGRFTLIGHSMGGQIALYLASVLAPERVDKLVSVAGVVAARLMPRAEHVNYRLVVAGAVFPWLYPLGRWLIRHRWYAYMHFRPWFHKMDALPFEAWEIDRRMAFQQGVRIPGYKAGKAIHNLDLTPHLRKITAPTLAIFGRQDGTVPVSDGHLLERLVPDGRLVLIDQCGHFPMYERPQQYLAALRNFLLD
jgi:pimeloyl-ACP methyl ester carboxylesterase